MHDWLLLYFAVVLLIAIIAYDSVPADFKTERELRIERLNAQPSQLPGSSLEENRARVLAHLATEAREAREEELAEALALFTLAAPEQLADEPELVS